jgi:hypothetical protein
MSMPATPVGKAEPGIETSCVLFFFISLFAVLFMYGLIPSCYLFPTIWTWQATWHRVNNMKRVYMTQTYAVTGIFSD